MVNGWMKNMYNRNGNQWDCTKPCCKYCGNIVKSGSICSSCKEKLRLVRKIRAIVAEIKKQADRERRIGLC